MTRPAELFPAICADAEQEWWQPLCAEIEHADARYGSPASTHESYGVLSEEVAELFDAIRANKLESVKYEALQVAAVAIRLWIACNQSRFQGRSVK